MATIKQAFKAARAAFAENYKHHGDYSAAFGGAHIALWDHGFSTRKARGRELLERVLACPRPNVERSIANSEACSSEF